MVTFLQVVTIIWSFYQTDINLILIRKKKQQPLYFWHLNSGINIVIISLYDKQCNYFWYRNAETIFCLAFIFIESI